MAVYFHGKFGLNRSYMSEVLSALVKNPKTDPTKIAKPFGYKAPFTNRYKSWLDKTGIMTIGVNPRLTEMGQVIWEMDPKLETLSTQWFMHHNLISTPENAEAWNFFVQTFLPKNQTFTKDNLQNQLAMKMMGHSEKHFRKGSPMNQVITNKLIDCYTNPEALGQLGLIKEVEKHTFQWNDPKSLGPWNSPDELLVSYE